MVERPIQIAFCGNPNVGKSTLFNALTGLHQHTGNWPGKTVESSLGIMKAGGETYHLIDLPGTYSLDARSPEETVTRDYICGGAADLIVVVCDGTCLARNLILALQVLQITRRVVVCVNLMDEARKKGISIDLQRLSRLLGVPVLGTEARKRSSVKKLEKCIVDNIFQPASAPVPIDSPVAESQRIAGLVETRTRSFLQERDRKIDRVLTHKIWAYPTMFLLLAVVLWLTIEGANYPSQWLGAFFQTCQTLLRKGLQALHAPWWLSGFLVEGCAATLFRVVSVMLPPMAIFFPLFTLLEDFGYLPRVAFNLDRPFARCGACGKQALTMCMGLGCNASAIVGCRIIDSKRERILAMLTNNFMPCNGRFPLLITLIPLVFVGLPAGNGAMGALILTGFILLGVLMTFLWSKLLSCTLLSGTSAAFVLELPPYRKPEFLHTIVRSILDRTLRILGRAAAVAAPVGGILWILANVFVGGRSLLAWGSVVLEPIGTIFGMDGVILLAFLLALPANEIVLPIALMLYTQGGGLPPEFSPEATRALLLENGWTWVTALCVMTFCLFHFPCSTALLTIKKESGSTKWMVLAAMIPTITGLICCLLIRLGALLF
ncbi:MAG: ferrous iron transporter B [Clostridia bacterium]|nr:ferrous iron transporter B [Clostridia bacterium]